MENLDLEQFHLRNTYKFKSLEYIGILVQVTVNDQEQQIYEYNYRDNYLGESEMKAVAYHVGKYEQEEHEDKCIISIGINCISAKFIKLHLSQFNREAIRFCKLYIYKCV